MLGVTLKKVFGSRNERELKKIQPLVEKINSLEPDLIGVTDAELAAVTPKVKEKLSKKKTLY